MVPALAQEHNLCSLCHNSATNSRLLPTLTKGSELFRSYASYSELKASALEGCHLCSLFLGTFKSRTQTDYLLSSVEVRLRVSRTGGAWLAVFALSREVGTTSNADSDLKLRYQLDEQLMGELSVFRRLEGRYEEPTPDSPFVFPTPSVYENAQLSKSLASDSSAALAKEWLNQCTQRHKKCSSALEALSFTDGYPTRLIDVGGQEGGEQLRLVETSELQASAAKPSYLTLSHCWGGADILKLLSENINDLKKNISFSALPRTFQDAIVVTRQLGFHYLWIDSLCIIQDSASDWRSESAIMGEIYAHSVCTIAALTARSSSEGCFFGRSSEDVQVARPQPHWNERTPLAFRVCHNIPHGFHVEFSTQLEPELLIDRSPLPLHARAWVVQERVLAPRTLYYGSWGLAWECVECSATEGFPFGKPIQFSPKASFFNTYTEASRSLGQSKMATIYGLWRSVQASYTQCQLTYFDDRLIAISSVIKRIEKLMGWTNVWGLWKEKLLYELLWFVSKPTERPRTKEYLAPTWSWAGLRGLVFNDTETTDVPSWSAEIVETGLEGGRGFLRLWSTIKRVVCTTDGPTWELKGDLVDKVEQKRKIVSWFPDTLPIAKGMMEELRCVLVLRIPGRVDKYAVDLGLVVSCNGDDIVRIGTFWQSRSDPLPLFDEDIQKEEADEMIIY